MSLDTRVSEVIKRIYSAGADRSAWDEIMVEMFQLVGCCAGVATLVDCPKMHLRLCRVYGPHHNGYCVEGYAERFRQDPTLQWAAKNSGVRYCDSRATVAPNEYDDHEFVQWTRSTLGSSFWYSGCATPTNGLTFCLSAHFAHQQEDSAEDLALFRLLFDHIECALRLGIRQFSAESARALLRLDNNAAVEQFSRGAERLLAERTTITVMDRRLSVTGPAQQQLLDRTIKQIFSKEVQASGPTAIQIKHNLGRPWIMVFRPVAEGYGPLGKVHRKVDVELFDRVPALANLEVIQSLFDLTGRELQVLRLLAQGHSIDSLSATLDVSRNTIRAHLRSIYSKTKTNSQVELMQLCSGLSSAANESEAAEFRVA